MLRESTQGLHWGSPQGKFLLTPLQKKIRFDIDNELKIRDVRYNIIWLKQQLKYKSFDVYHMKHNYAQKWTVSEQSAISDFKKSVLFFVLSNFCTFFFCQNLTTFFESLITHKRFNFEESYILYGKRRKSSTLIVV